MTKRDMSLTERQSEILERVCQQYIKQALPISSQYLKEKHRLPYSSATIRAEFLELENQNYLEHPYISSGRIPTDKGYRFLVDRILEQEYARPSVSSRFSEIESMFSELKNIEDALKVSHCLAKALSDLSSCLAIAYVSSEGILWKEGWERVTQEPEFKDIQSFRNFLKAVAKFETNIDRFECPRNKIKIYIGKENPFREKEISLLITKCLFPKQIEEFIAIVGPKRMDFERNISLINSLIQTVEDFN